MPSTWEDSLELGIAGIDEEHRRFWSLCLQLERALDAGDAVRAALLAGTICGHTVLHFAREEEELVRLGYAQAYPAEFERHTKDHRRLLTEIERRLSKLEGSPPETEGIVTFLRASLIEHMLRVDLLYQEFALTALETR